MGSAYKHPIINGEKENTVLRRILEGTAAYTGETFFQQLVKHLSLALGTNAAWISEYVEGRQRLRALAFWINGSFLKGYEFDIKGTPCETVLGKKEILHIPRNVIDLFPDDPELQNFKAMSYLGVPLLDVRGHPIGNLAVMDIHEMPEDFHNMALFRIFADRGASELRRIRTEQKLRDREQELNRLFNSVMDAIIEVDPLLKITQANMAAVQLFEGGDHNKMVAKNFEKYLSEDSANKLKNLIKGIRNRPKGNRFLWVPGGFQAVNHKKISFQFEATLSAYEHNHNQYFNLILRNVTDRIEAEKRIGILSAQARYLRQEIDERHNTEEIIGDCEEMQNLKHLVGQVAETDATVLLLGETGTGKELVARAIHSSSKRKDKPLIKVNCAAIPESLIESELFGHEKGAFTGAIEQRKGRFSIADGGTIFLDEIGDLQLSLQSKLLRVLQEGEFEAIGSSQTHKVDCRIIAATNRDLRKMVMEGNFRADLYYRLNVFPIFIPPLRDRGDDILSLAQTFIELFSKQFGRNIKPLKPMVKNYLRSYDWPGNVRELQNVIERAVITSRDEILNLPNLPSGMLHNVQIHAEQSATDRILTAEQLIQIERQNIIRALETASWKVAGKGGAAHLIGVPSSTLSSRLKALKIKRPAS
jgi:PAS domain S-box-containing protein